MSDHDDVTVLLRQEMRAATLADSAAPDLLRRVQRACDRRSRRRVLGGTALALVGVVGVGAAVSSARSSGPATGTLAGPASTLLSPRPDVTASAPTGPADDELRAAQWFNYRSAVVQTDLTPPGHNEQRWVSRDGTHVAEEPDGTHSTYTTTNRFPYGEHGLTFDQVLALPADPAVLRAGLPGPNGQGRDSNTVDSARQLLGRGPVLLPVRKAILEVLASLPGATVVEDQTDSLGRAATLLRYTEPDGHPELLFIDPTSYRLLEEGTLDQDALEKTGSNAARSDGPQAGYRETFLGWTTDSPG